MAVLGYFDVFPEKTRTELRAAIFEDDNAVDDADRLLPVGIFIFTEFFCTDLSCDCQRVLVKVFHTESEDVTPVEVATISYTWNPSSDDTWKMVHSEMPNPFLDPLHRQVSYASELLDFWSAMIEHDKAYASRIRRHYDEIRAEIGQTQVNWGRRDVISHESHKRPFRQLTKQDRKARKRQLDRVLKRK